MNVNGAGWSSKFYMNQQVKTPLGRGQVLSPFEVVSETGEVVSRGVAVRLPINEVTSKALRERNCLTPTARVSGLWVFAEGDLS